MSSTPEPFQIREATVRGINDMGRQIRDEMSKAMPEGAVLLWPSVRDLPRGWGVADGTNGRPDLSAYAFSGYVYVVRLG